MTVGERMACLREARGLTREQLAKEVGVTRQMIYKYESNTTDPRLFIFICIADVLKVSLDYLAKGDSK
jgi:transcriptional regulator with XRE-family HTH domain